MAEILNVLSRVEYEAGPIDGAISITYMRLRTRLKEVTRGRRIHVHCGRGAGQDWPLRSSGQKAWIQSCSMEFARRVKRTARPEPSRT